MTDPLTSTLTLLVGITFYYGEAFDGVHLACPGDYWYRCDGSMEPWGAFPLEWFSDGRFQCGDRVKITFRSGRVQWVKALDVCPGCLHSRIYDTGRVFGADLSRCWRDGEPTGTGKVWNLDHALRERQRFEFGEECH